MRGVSFAARRLVASFAVVTTMVLASTGASLAGVSEILDATGDGNAAELSTPGRLTVDSAGNLYVAGTLSNNVFRVAPDSTITEIVAPDGDGAGNGLDQPVGVAVAADGTVYVAGRVSTNILRVDPSGAVSLVVDLGLGAGNNVFAVSLRDLVMDSAGILYVAGGGSDNVLRVDPSLCAPDPNACLTEVIDASGDGAGNALQGPSALATDSNDNLYVAGGESDNVFRVTPGGSVDLVVGGDGNPFDATTLEEPLGLSVDSSDTLYVTGFASDNAFRVDPAGAIAGTDGAVEQIISSIGDGLGPKFGSELRGPRGIVANDRGEVFVSGSLSGNVFMVIPGGLIFQALDDEANGAEVDGVPVVFELPVPLAADADGSVFIGGAGSNNVLEFTGRPLLPLQRTCVLRMNKLYKVLVINYHKHYLNCLKRVDSPQLVEDCFADTGYFGKDKIGRLVDKSTAKFPKQCPVPPHFGPSSVADIAQAASEQQSALLDDIYGSDFDAISMASDPVDYSCQVDMMRQYKQCQVRHLNDFFKCKKNGMKGKKKLTQVPFPDRSPFEGIEALEDCIGFDPKGKVERACSTIMLGRLDLRCPTTPLGTAFPGVCSANSSSTDFRDCVQQVSTCRACRGFNAADGLSKDCDLMDNGVAGDGSCPAPTPDLRVPGSSGVSGVPVRSGSPSGPEFTSAPVFR